MKILKFLAIALIAMATCARVRAQGGTASQNNFPGGLVPNSVQSPSNTITSSPLCPASSTTCFPAKWDAHWGSKPTFTATSNIVTCTDCNFTATDILGRPYAVVGQIAFGTTATNDVTMGTSVLATPECLIQSVDSNTQVHLGTVGSIGTACNATQNTTASGRFVWGDLDSASATQTQGAGNDNLFAAWTAASNNCAQLQLPAGATLVEQSEFVTYSTTAVCGQAPSITGERFGFSIVGAGPNATIIIPTPSFLSSTCTGPNAGGTGCLFTLPNPTYADFSVIGEGNTACGAGFSGKNLVQLMGNSTFVGTNGLVRNVKLLGWCANTSGTDGFVIGSGSNTISGMDTYDLWVENFGCNGVVTNSAGTAVFNWNGGEYWNNAACGPVLTVASGIFKSSKGYHGSSANTQKLVSITGGAGTDYNSIGDYLTGSSNEPVISCDSTGGATVHIVNDSISGQSGSTPFMTTASDTCSVYITNSIVKAAANSRIAYANSSSTLNIYDGSGNTYTTGTGGNGPGTLNWYGAGNGDSIHAACTGTANSSATLGLFGTGPNETLTTCTSTTIGSGIVMRNAGTLLNLLVTATHAGVSASSGVVTVLKNGSSQTMTCTIGTATTCNDGVHTVSYVAGDLISIQFTTQGSEVLAGVNATIVAN